MTLPRSFAACVLIATVALAGCTPRVVDTGVVPGSWEEYGVVDHSWSQPRNVVMTHLELDITVDFDTQRIGGTAAIDIDNKTGAGELILDTWALDIIAVTFDDGTPARYALGDSLAIVGRALVIDITPQTRRVVIEYRTTAGARGVQWLTPQQTLGRKQPFLYTQSQAILARTWVPCQDTPGVRFSYVARVTVPRELLALMSARNPISKSPYGTYRFEMPQPIPAYLLALVVGDLEYRAIGDRTGVYAEPAMVGFAEWEFADMERMMGVAEDLYGPYRWEQFDVIVLPPSFPYGGMENPRLTFVTPILVAGDRSLVSTIAHELAHSWSGNLVTNATWDDFWLNEGFTTYLERRIMEALYGRDVSEMHAILGRQALDDEIARLGAESPDNALAIELGARDPDEFLGMAPYEKGYLFLRMLEEAFGRDAFDEFLRGYFEAFAFRSTTTERFMDYLTAELFNGDGVRMRELRVRDWVYGVALPDNAPAPESPRFDAVDAQVAAWDGGAAASQLDVDGWMPQQWDHFLTHISAQQSVKRLSELDTAFNFSGANGEVRRSWFLLVIENEYVPAYPALDEFLVVVGRRWLIHPLYSKLAETPEGLEWARGVYGRARPGYHAVTAATIDGILGWKETE